MITPVPGGVGPMTIAMLLRNTLQAARARRPQGVAADARAYAPGELLAGGGTVVLFVFLFLDWFTAGGAGRSGWGALGWGVTLLLVVMSLVLVLTSFAS